MPKPNKNLTIPVSLLLLILIAGFGLWQSDIIKPTQAAILSWVNPDSPLGLNLHPRLFFIPQSFREANPNAVGITVQEMRDKIIANSALSSQFQDFVNAMDAKYASDIQPIDRQNTPYDGVNFAFLYMMDPEIMSQSPYNFQFQFTKNQYGQKAIEYMTALANARLATTEYAENTWYEGHQSGGAEEISVPLAIMFDWTYNLLTQSQKELFIDEAIWAYTKSHEQSYLAAEQPFLTNRSIPAANNGEAEALVVFGESYRTNDIQIMLNSIDADWNNRIYDFSEFILEGSSYWFEAGYSNYLGLSLRAMLLFTQAIATATNENYFNDYSVFRDFYKYYLFNTKPLPVNGNYRLFRFGDDADASGTELPRHAWDNKGIKPLIILSNVLETYDNEAVSVLKWLLRDSGFIKKTTITTTDAIYDFILSDNSIPARSPSALNMPLSVKLGRGQYFMRSGFTDPADTFIQFSAPKYFAGISHAHKDFASFQISKLGDLAIKRSIGKSFAGGNIGITKNSTFYNTIVVYKPDEYTRETASYFNIMAYRESSYYTSSDGSSQYFTGQGFDGAANTRDNPAFQNGGANHVGTVKAEDLEGSNYDYINYDYSNSWSDSKVSFAKRQFVYLRSQNGTNDEYVITYDQVESTDPSYTKYYLLHASFEPEVDGTMSQARPGKWISSDSSEIKITNTWNGSHGRLFNKTLLPNSFQINKIGGPGYYWQDAGGQVIWPNGKTGKTDLTDEEKNDRGSYTMQIQATTNQIHDHFLNVMQFGDSNTLNAMNPTTRIDGDTMVGTLINDPHTPRIVMFSRDNQGNNVSNVTYTATYPSDKTARHLLVNIAPGTYDIYKNNIKIHSNLTAQLGENTLTFTASGGSTFQVVQTGSTPETPSTCTDNTLYNQCSSTKPKYCSNGSLINKASECGCPQGQEASGDSCVYPEQDPDPDTILNPVCSEDISYCTTQSLCEDQSYYWYDNFCHTEAQTTNNTQGSNTNTQSNQNSNSNNNSISSSNSNSSNTSSGGGGSSSSGSSSGGGGGGSSSSGSSSSSSSGSSASSNSNQINLDTGLTSTQQRVQDNPRTISDIEKEVIQREKSLSIKINISLTNRLLGKILLQVESLGEAYYLDPITKLRYYLQNGESAYESLSIFGLGITNNDLSQIPIGLEPRAELVDTDGDGLDDQLEDGIGTDKHNPDTDNDGFNDGEEVKNGFNPISASTNGASPLLINKALVNRLKGRIVLQVENHGEAWYINPTDNKRYYMKDGNLAYQIMRFLSLGITNEDLRQIGVGSLASDQGE